VVSLTPLPLYPWNIAPNTHWIEGWVGSRAALVSVEKNEISCSYRELNSSLPVLDINSINSNHKEIGYELVD
jgi:hypothetical protein